MVDRPKYLSRKADPRLGPVKTCYTVKTVWETYQVRGGFFCFGSCYHKRGVVSVPRPV